MVGAINLKGRTRLDGLWIELHWWSQAGTHLSNSSATQCRAPISGLQTRENVNAMENILYVNTQELLSECAVSLEGVDIVGLDTETKGLVEDADARISLIQISSGEGESTRAWVIDCLCGLDLRPIRDLVFNPEVCKVIHFADFDVKMLSKCFNWSARNVWCTYTAEKRTGLRRGLKLKDLAERYFAVEMDKSFQEDDWMVRPLTLQQIQYAGLDAIIVLRIFYEQRRLGLNGSYDKAAQAILSPEMGSAPQQESRRKTHRSMTKLEWDAETRELIDWFVTAKLPADPFILMEGHQIVDPARWYSSLREEIDAGPSIPRGRTGALRMDLAALRSILKDSYGEA